MQETGIFRYVERGRPLFPRRADREGWPGRGAGPGRRRRGRLITLISEPPAGVPAAHRPGRWSSFPMFPARAQRSPATWPGRTPVCRRSAGGTAVSGPPYAAVVVLHGCGGISSHSIAIADRLGSWGYVALTVDSLGPRGITNACGGSVGTSQAFDAYAALRYLAAQDFVDPKRIAVLAQSMGGIVGPGAAGGVPRCAQPSYPSSARPCHVRRQPATFAFRAS